MAELAFGADKGIENRQNVTAVFDHARKHVAEMRFALGIFVPLREDRRGNFDIAAKLFRGMSPEKQAVEKRCLALREGKIREDVGWQNGSDGSHSKNAVYRKVFRRQVERQFQCREPVKADMEMDATEGSLTGSNRT